MKNHSLKIRHDRQYQMFQTRVDDEIAYLKYERPEKHILNFTETFVPAKYRNQGIAKKIVQHAMEHADRSDFHVIATCPFVKDYIDKNPRYEKIEIEQKEGE